MNSSSVGFPNYAAKQALSINTNGTAPNNGWILYTIDMGDTGEFVLYIQEQIVSKAGINYGSDSVGVAFPIKAGWTYRTTSNRNSPVNLYFVPFAG